MKGGLEAGAAAERGGDVGAASGRWGFAPLQASPVKMRSFNAHRSQNPDDTPASLACAGRRVQFQRDRTQRKTTTAQLHRAELTFGPMISVQEPELGATALHSVSQPEVSGTQAQLKGTTCGSACPSAFRPPA